LFSLYASLFLPYGVDACSREPVPSASRLIFVQGSLFPFLFV
jgi:hypothetical protein